jgi:hypothetical protein
VQFCGNDPQTLLAAARAVEDKCDAVDLNLGCPQGIARKGRYGAYLLEEQDVVLEIVRTLSAGLKGTALHFTACSSIGSFIPGIYYKYIYFSQLLREQVIASNRVSPFSRSPTYINYILF